MAKNKRFDIILIDPPWRYNARNNPGTRFGQGVHSHYDTMSNAELKALPIRKLMDADALIFLWVTNPFLKKQIEVMEAWGAVPATVAFCWVKTNKNNGKPFFGIGNYTASNIELCLVGRWGRMLPITGRKQSQVVIHAKMEHSRKPEAIQDRIDAMYPNCRKIEFFARRRRPGWVCVGKEVTGNDIRTDIDILLEERR